MDAKRILLADDSPTVRMMLSKALQSAGFNVTSVENGGEAVERMKSEQFDLLLLDVEMPVMNGLQVLKLIQDGKVQNPAPVLVVTGTRKTLDEVHELRRLGARGYVGKGMPETELVFRVQKVFEGFDETLA